VANPVSGKIKKSGGHLKAEAITRMVKSKAAVPRLFILGVLWLALDT
jgi:hypothetical protein